MFADFHTNTCDMCHSSVWVVGRAIVAAKANQGGEPPFSQQTLGFCAGAKDSTPRSISNS